MRNAKLNGKHEVTVDSRLRRSALHLGSGMFGSYTGMFSEEVTRKQNEGGHSAFFWD